MSYAGNNNTLVNVNTSGDIPLCQEILDLKITKGKASMSLEQPSERWITLEEAAAHLQVSKSFLYQKGGLLGIPRVKIGTKYRYKRSELDAWLMGRANELH